MAFGSVKAHQRSEVVGVWLLQALSWAPTRRARPGTSWVACGFGGGGGGRSGSASNVAPSDTFTSGFTPASPSIPEGRSAPPPSTFDEELLPLHPVTANPTTNKLAAVQVQSL